MTFFFHNFFSFFLEDTYRSLSSRCEKKMTFRPTLHGETTMATPAASQSSVPIQWSHCTCTGKIACTRDGFQRSYMRQRTLVTNRPMYLNIFFVKCFTGGEMVPQQHRTRYKGSTRNQTFVFVYVMVPIEQSSGAW